MIPELHLIIRNYLYIHTSLRLAQAASEQSSSTQVLDLRDQGT